MRQSAWRRAWTVLVSAVGLGVIAGLVWWHMATPGQWEMRDVGLSLTEEASRGQFQVIVVFTLIGVIAALAWSVVLSLLFGESGWQLVVAIMAGSVLAAIVAWQVGAFVGPPPVETAVGLEIGDTVPDELMIDSASPFLAWPIAALVGVLLVSWGRGREPVSYERDTDATTAPVIDSKT
ncbi:MAG: hypothetical protein WBQ48_11565 [Aeromicrobium sp.]